MIRPRDIGWISLFGGAGTLVAAAVTAIPSTRENPSPILAGLAIGPAVGMVAGAIIWPHIRGAEPEEPSRLEDPAGVGGASSGAMSEVSTASVASAFRITEWDPLMMVVPSREGSTEAPMMFGVRGKLW